MLDWQVTDDSTQEVFLKNMIDNLDRVKKLDETYYSYDRVKEEFLHQASPRDRLTGECGVSVTMQTARNRLETFNFSTDESQETLKKF